MAHLVLAEANAITALVLRIHLRRAGHTVTVVEHGDQVATTVQADLPDLILLDAWLSDPSGLTVAQQLKADPETRSIPIIMRTALSDPQWLCTVRSCGADAVWTAPTDPAALLRIIESLLPPSSARLLADRGHHVRSSA